MRAYSLPFFIVLLLAFPFVMCESINNRSSQEEIVSDKIIFEGKFSTSSAFTYYGIPDSIQKLVVLTYDSLLNESMLSEFVRLSYNGLNGQARNLVEKDPFLAKMADEYIVTLYNLKMVYDEGLAFNPLVCRKRNGGGEGDEFIYLSEEKYLSVKDSIESGIELKLIAKKVGQRPITGFSIFYSE